MVHIIQSRNVSAALPMAVELLLTSGEKQQSRNGEVLAMPAPVVTVLERPWERVLLSPVRDANPFLHLVESAWMLAGRNDVASLTPYVKRFADYAEPGGVIHGAYGYRWRRHFGYDQLAAVIEKLKADPGTRQAVIQMWDTSAPHLLYDGNWETSDYKGFPETYTFGGDDLRGDWKDRPCNTQIFLRLTPGNDAKPGALSMTVTSRSHDVLWGLLGANAVHFSVLQEYLATALNVSMGPLTFFSNNFHVYTDVLEKMTAGHADKAAAFYPPAQAECGDQNFTWPGVEEAILILWKFLDVIHNPGLVTQDTVEKWDQTLGNITSLFFYDVAKAALVHRYYRDKNMKEALEQCEFIFVPEWRRACTGWLERRMK